MKLWPRSKELGAHATPDTTRALRARDPDAEQRLHDAEGAVRLLYAHALWLDEAYEAVSTGLERAIGRLIELDDAEGLTFVPHLRARGHVGARPDQPDAGPASVAVNDRPLDASDVNAPRVQRSRRQPRDASSRREGCTETAPVTPPKRASVSGRELRLLADRADAAGQKQLALHLHDLARGQELEDERR